MFTVGLDFGTHQTKICIEDATNPNQKIYDFFTFENENIKTFFLPSIVQINSDETVSYGFVDESKCMKINFNNNIISINSLKRPELHIPKKPKLLELPIQPNRENLTDRPKRYEEVKVTVQDSDLKSIDPNFIKLYKLKQELLEKENITKQKQFNQSTFKDHQKKIIAWELECKRVEEKNKKNRIKWEKNRNRINIENNEKLDSWRKKCIKIETQYYEDILKYESTIKKLYYLNFDTNGIISSEKLDFRYFKFYNFFKSSYWKHQISSEKISICYLTNIIFLLEEKYGDNFYTQMGIPTDNEINDFKNKQKIGAKLLVSAFKLREKYKTYKDFLNEKFYDLFEKIIIYTEFSNEDLELYGLNFIPEAYAGLISLTQSKKLVNGISLLVDIGGGTTDIGLFTIQKELPIIYKVLSIDKGLNFIIENSSDFSNMSQNEQILFFNQDSNNNTNYELAENLLIKEIEFFTSKITEKLRQIFSNNQNLNGLDISALTKALDNRPIVFTGGGSNHKPLFRKINNFSDIKKITTDILPFGLFKQKISNVELSILNTSFGLSIPLENGIKITSIEKIFNDIDYKKNDSNHNYIHGLTD